MSDRRCDKILGVFERVWRDLKVSGSGRSLLQSISYLLQGLGISSVFIMYGKQNFLRESKYEVTYLWRHDLRVYTCVGSEAEPLVRCTVFPFGSHSFVSINTRKENLVIVSWDVNEKGWLGPRGTVVQDRRGQGIVSSYRVPCVVPKLSNSNCLILLLRINVDT